MIWRMLCWSIEEGDDTDNNDDDDDDDDGDVHCLAVFITLMLVRLLLRKCLKQIILIKYNRVKNPNWLEANQLAFYKRSWGVELGTTMNKSSWQSWVELNSRHSNYKCSTLTAWPRCLPQYVAPTENCIILHILSNQYSIFFSVFIVNILDISTIKWGQ